jgi:hypothetical protein
LLTEIIAGKGITFGGKKKIWGCGDLRIWGFEDLKI